MYDIWHQSLTGTGYCFHFFYGIHLLFTDPGTLETFGVLNRAYSRCVSSTVMPVDALDLWEGEEIYVFFMGLVLGGGRFRTLWTSCESDWVYSFIFFSCP